MIHDQSVTPSSVFAKVPLVRNKAIATSRDAAAAIAHQVETEERSSRDLLARQLIRLRGALAARVDSGKLTPNP